ncbi:MAG TPA: PAS domain S-box protein, partial [Gemmatimonadaceae bacterium]|nr:PAS domain S-box protein [Gemmatimonadaceae bacterium]
MSDGCTDAQAESFARARRATSATSDEFPVHLGRASTRHLQHLIRLARATLGVDGVHLRLVRATGAGDEPHRWTVSTAASTLPLVADAPAPLHGTLDAVALEWNQTLMIDDVLASVWRIARPPERTALAFLGQPFDVGSGVRGVMWAWSRWRREWTAEEGRSLGRFVAAAAEELAAGAPPESGELALRWRDTVLAALTSRSPLALAAIDHRTDEVLLYSQRFLELFGLEHLEPRLAACAVDARELDAACRERLLSRSGEPARPAFPLAVGGHSDELLELADGRTLRRVAFPVPAADDDTVAPMCEGYLFEDATERVRAQRTLENRTALLEAVLESSPLALVATAVDGTTLMWNHAAERAFGWRAEEVVGGPSPAIPEEERPLHAAERAAALANVPWEGREVELVRRDGTRIYMAAFSSVMPVSDWSMATPSGAAEPAVLTAYADLTERQELEQRLRDAQKREVVGRLAAGTAHDFNNLLTAIIGYADLALESLDRRTSAARDVMEIRQTAERATCLTRQLLAFTRRTPTGGGICQPSEVVRSLENLLRRLAGPDVELDWLLGASGTVRVDPVHLEQVVLNLVVNARDAMPDGGMVVIETDDVVIGEDGRTDPADSPWHAPAGLSAGPYVAVAVRDQGDGIPPDV